MTRTAIAADPWREGMTLGEAADYIRKFETGEWACACHGPPYCCMDTYRWAQMVVRGGHIAIKQIAARTEEVEGR